MLIVQTGLPPNQSTTLQVENVHNFGIFQPIWLKLVTKTQNGRTQCIYVTLSTVSTLTGQIGLPPNQLKSEQVRIQGY